MIVDILIIGAGIYGISIANCFKQTNLSFKVVGNFMDLWYHHTFKNMNLRSDFMLSEIYDTKGKFSVEIFLSLFPKYQKYKMVHLPVFVFKKYLNWVKENLDYPIENSKIKLLEFALKKGIFHAKLANGKVILAKNVIIATGLSDHQYIPPEFLFQNKKIIHSYETETISHLTGKKTLVVGNGQSAAECMEALLAKHNQVSRFQRSRPVFLNQPVNIPLWLFRSIEKSGGFFYHTPELVRKSLTRVLSTPTIMPLYKNILDKTPLHQDLNNTDCFDNIICATGYRFNINRIDFLSEDLKSELSRYTLNQLVNKNFESPVKGLFFTGPITSSIFGPSMKFIVGARFASKRIVTCLMKNIH